jgi:hypothetical protein
MINPNHVDPFTLADLHRKVSWRSLLQAMLKDNLEAALYYRDNPEEIGSEPEWDED